MANTADFPPRPRPRPPRSDGARRLRLIIGIIGLFLTVGVGLFRSLAVFYTDYLFFRSVELTGVWSYLLSTKVLLAVVSVLITFALLWLNIWVADRNAPKTLFTSADDELTRQYQRYTRPRAKKVRTIMAAVLAFVAGASLSRYWQEYTLFLNGGSFGVVDPQFGEDIGFFVFKLPFLTALLSWLFFTLMLCLVVSITVHYLQGSIRPQATSNRVGSIVKRHVSVLLAAVALVRAAQYFLDRYRLMYSERGVVRGANYTDVEFLLPALGLLTLISVAAAVVLLFGLRYRSWQIPVITVALWGVVSVLTVGLIPAAVQQFSVRPAESQKEAPYIARNIEATRAALDIEDVTVNDFPYNESLTAAQLQENRQTIRNVRLWDPAVAEPSYKRLQENRSFFSIDNVDIDRYPVNGEVTQLNVAVRELNIGGLPQERRSWVNQHLAFTHGYGAVLSPANAVTPDGAPVFIVRDLPPTGTPAIERPQVYFGEYQNPYSIVRSGLPEVDYIGPDGADVTSRYEGRGGVPLDNPLKKAAFAARVGDINPLISPLVNDDSKAMYLTNIRERQLKVAPFLKFDSDPYPVLQGGRILWISDAYTTTDAYPNAQLADTSQLAAGPGTLRESRFNYVRNSVKVVTDAYDGNMTFYVMDDQDPIIKAWQKAFPGLFVDGRTMPDEVRAHIRFPEDMFKVQTTAYGRYHLTEPGAFYSASDRWIIARSPLDRPRTASPSTTAPPVQSNPTRAGLTPPPAAGSLGRIDPYYLLMRLPNEERDSFLMLQPFVPFSSDDRRQELTAFMVAKSDPIDYGQLQAFVMPRDRLPLGPELVDARINQDPEVAAQILPLTQRGADVRFGSMLTIPIENSLLYVRPLYATAQQNNVPELTKVIVVYGARVEIADTLQQALTRIFGAAPATLEQVANQPAPGANGAVTVPVPAAPGAPATPATPVAPGSTRSPQEVTDLLTRAEAEFTAADQALRNGDLAEYQRRVQAGVELVRQAKS